MKPTITLPNRSGQGAFETLQAQNNIVIVGANGSGKTRLGAWIETQLQNTTPVHRISAQRALNLPEYASVKNLEQAEKGLFFGRDDQYGNANYKRGARWGDQPETHMLDDYEKLLSALFARSAKRDREHTIATKESQAYLPVVDAPIDTIIKLWNDLMPHRQITFDDGKVSARKNNQAAYHGRQMSDGERVTLYLIGQCLCAQENSIIIIDEPEIHLHKSLMSKVWNKIEEFCENKLLVFITHDLDFAASRALAKKIWVKGYEGDTSWQWEEIPEIEGVPENLVIEILGNRKNVIFCEGEDSSYDCTLYQEIFPEYHIIPRGGCEKVIESTKAIRGNPSLHHLNAFGIVDRDYRTDPEIAALLGSGIFTIDVAEIENLFCIEPILRIVAENQHLNADTTVTNVTAFIINTLQQELEVQVTNRVEREIQFRLNSYVKTGHSEQGLTQGLQAVFDSINVNQFYLTSRALYQHAIDQNSLERALKLYNRKNLPRRISQTFGLANDEYPNIVLRLLKTSKKEAILNALRAFMPALAQ